MLDFRLNRKEQPSYIIKAIPTTTVVKNEDGEEEFDDLEVYYGDGKVYHISNNKENIRKIEVRQDKQVTEGVANLPVFERRLEMAKIATAVGVISGPIVGTFIATVAERVAATESDPFKACLGVGVLTLGLMAPGCYKLVRNYPIVSQLRKFKFRNDNRNDLNSFEQYPNALVGLSKEKAASFKAAKENGEDPFSVMNVDTYTQADLETIIDNINRGKEFQFVYTRSKPTSNKNSQQK